MERIGRLTTVGLRAADLVKVRPAQIAAARLVRRFYRVGGMTSERLRVWAQADAHRSVEAPESRSSTRA
jgi:hypothetical protein